MSATVAGASSPAAGSAPHGTGNLTSALAPARLGPELVFVAPAGAEERAVRRALARAGSAIPVVATGIGPLAAARTARELLADGVPARVIVTGLCGLLGPSFAVGEALVYRDVVTAAESTRLDPELSRSVAERVSGSLSGVRAFATGSIVTRAIDKRALGGRYGAQAVDMETRELAQILAAAGVAVAALRIGSDAVSDDLPELNRALDGAGGMDGFALALALLRRPLAGARLARNGTRALAALERAVFSFAMTNA